MQIQTIVDITLHAMILVLWLSLPAIIVASVMGLLVSLAQAITQVQDQTISFAVKLVTIVITLVLTARWIGGEIFNYAKDLFDSFSFLVK